METVNKHAKEPYEHARIFNNPFLEALTRTSPRITLVAYSSYTILLLAFGTTRHLQLLYMPLVYVGGLLFWSFFEYIMHRYVFHINEHIRGTDRFQFIVHGVHHSHPKDEERVFMPPVPGFLITSLLVLERERDGTISLRGFWSRRFRRLMPASLLLLLAVALLTPRVGSDAQLSALPGDIWSALGYVFNWHSILGQSDYAASFATSSVWHRYFRRRSVASWSRSRAAYQASRTRECPYPLNE